MGRRNAIAAVSNGVQRPLAISGCIAYWPFNETSHGSNARDIVGGFDLTASNNPTPAAGRSAARGSRQLFSGGNGSQAAFNRSGTATTPALIPAGQSFSFAFWIKPAWSNNNRGTGSTAFFVNFLDTTAAAAQIRLGSGNAAGGWNSYNSRVYYTDTTFTTVWIGPDNATTNPQVVLPDAQWTHLVWLYDSAAHQIRIFRNGALYSTVAAVAGKTVSGIGGSLRMSAAVPGLVADWALFDRALTADEALTLASTTNLIAGFSAAITSPLDVPNCAIWLDAADTGTMYTTSAGPASPATTPGQPVGYWADKSGNARHFNSSTSPPTLQSPVHNNLPAVAFNNSNLRCINRDDPTSQETVFLVATVTNTVNNSRFFTQGTAGGADFDAAGHWIPLLRNASTASLSSWALGANRSAIAFSTGAPTLMVATHTGTTFTTRANTLSAPPYTPHTLSQTINRYGLFDDTNGVAISNGRIMEVIVYHRALSAAERAGVERYLNNKWGLGFIPPLAAHPDAQRWIQQVYFNGGTVSQTTADAVSNFCREIDAAGLRSKFYRLNLFCGNELLACRTPLYRGPNANERHGFDLDVLTVGSGGSAGNVFTNVDYTEYGSNAGLAGRLQTAGSAHPGPGLRTGFVPYFVPAFYGFKRPDAPSFNYSSLHLAVYCRSLQPQTVGTGYLIGAYGGIGPAQAARHGMSYYVNQSAWGVGPFAAATSGTYDGVNRGFYLATVQPTGTLVSNEHVNELSLYAGSVKYGSEQVSLGPFLHPLADFSIFGEGRANVAYSQNDNSLFRAQQRLQGYSIGLGMTEAEVQMYRDIMNRFQTALSRNV
jgi:hypothetical protein